MQRYWDLRSGTFEFIRDGHDGAPDAGRVGARQGEAVPRVHAPHLALHTVVRVARVRICVVPHVAVLARLQGDARVALHEEERKGDAALPQLLALPVVGPPNGWPVGTHPFLALASWACASLLRERHARDAELDFLHRAGRRAA